MVLEILDQGGDFGGGFGIRCGSEILRFVDEAAAGVPEARVVLVGDGPLRGQLEERAKQNDLMEEVGHSPFAERAGLREGGEFCHREGGRISRVLFAGFRNQGQLPAYLAGTWLS